MAGDLQLASLFTEGGLYKNISGKTVESVLADICTSVALPRNLDRNELYTELFAREKVSSTAIGNGIAIPHAKMPFISNVDDQRIIICYLKEPIDMDAPDGRKVFVMFLILAANVHYHQQIIVKLAELFKKHEFRKKLEAHSDLDELLTFIQ